MPTREILSPPSSKVKMMGPPFSVPQKISSREVVIKESSLLGEWLSHLTGVNSPGSGSWISPLFLEVDFFTGERFVGLCSVSGFQFVTTWSPFPDSLVVLSRAW